MDTKQDSRLGTAPLGRLIASMAIPSVAAQLINVLYNIVDRVYIGHIAEYGDMALTGVGVTFPMITLISAFSAFAGMGAAPLASIELGRKDYDRAEKILGTSTAMLLGFACLLMALFLLFRTPLLYAFGATDNTITYADRYITVYLLGTFFVQLALGLNPFISGQGNAKTAMLSVVIGAVVNIVLDPVFIFVLQMGVRGAAFATIISQAVSCLWVVHFLTSEKSVMRIRKKNIRLDRAMVTYIASLGVSPFIMQSTESFVLITLNSGLKKYGGDLYVGSMSILSSVMQLIVVPIQGFNQGVQPIISYNYGAGNWDRVVGAFKRMLAVSLTASFVLAGSAVRFPQLYSGLFTDKEALLSVTNRVMPVYFLGMILFGIQISCQSSFIALRQAKISLFIALLRKVILLIPLALILPRFFGVMGIYCAEPVADVISLTTSAVLFAVTMKKIRLQFPV